MPVDGLDPGTGLKFDPRDVTMASKIDLTWVDPALQADMERAGTYLAPQQVPFCGHEQALVAVQGKRERWSWVDAELAPIFRWCWRNGIALVWGCEGMTHEFPWSELDFDTHDDLVRFLDTVVPFDETPGSRYDFAFGRASRQPENCERRWHLVARPSERLYEEDGVERVGHGIDYTLRIPPPDLEWVATVTPLPPEPVDTRMTRRSRGATLDLAEEIAKVDLNGPTRTTGPTLDDLLRAQAWKEAEAQRRRQGREGPTGPTSG